MPKRPGTLASLGRAMTSWRTASIALLSFSSGMPLGLVWIAIPDWLRKSGADLTTIGLITLAQAPWAFKMVWAPLMDRFTPPWLGRRRGWAAIAQVALFVLTLALAGLGNHPETPWVIGALAFAIAFASATQDIAIDAYAVDVLRPEEHGVASGARTAVYRAAMFIAGGLSITLAGAWSWPAVNVCLALLYLPMLVITRLAPEPEAPAKPPRSLTEAVWHPFLGFLARHRALEILAFVFLYKLVDNLAQALLRPFLIDMGYSDFDRGVALATVATVATLVGVFLGGALTNVLGLGRSLWVFGFLMIFSNLGYVLLAGGGVNRPLMLGAMGFESLTQGLSTGAFAVLLLRITQKRFSATQYALFTSLYGVPRLLSGPIAGFAADALGWRPFFWLTLLAGLPGLAMLARFVPIGVREPELTVEPVSTRPPLPSGGIARRGVAGGAVAALLGALCVALLEALKAMRGPTGRPFGLAAPLAGLLHPAGAGDWLRLAGLLIFGAACGLLTAAVVAARHGVGRELALDEPSS